jgi:MarR family 2-MHQ and catechol resistance regulon transcriptional repressor
MDTTSASPGPRYQALLQLFRTAEGLWDISRRFFDRWDLSPSQFNLLNLLQGEPNGRTQIELSRELIMHRSNVTGLVDRLEARGLVRRAANPLDRRVWRIELTAAGGRLISQVLPSYYAAAEAVWGDIPAARARQILYDLAQLTANAQQITTEIT